MNAIIGSIIGLGTALGSGVIDIVKSNGERKSRIEEAKIELDTLKAKAVLEIDRLKVESELKIKEQDNQADIDEGKQLREHDIAIQSGTGFISKLQQSVRPIITYTFFLFFLSSKISILFGFALLADKILDSETMTLFSAIISFWFGSRTIDKFRKNGMK